MSLRQKKVADQIRDRVGSLFQGGHLNDPRLRHVTISYVKVSSDLQVASLYYRVIGIEGWAKLEIDKGLASATSLFRKEIAKHIELRRVPDLRFFYDETVERASRIDELLSQL